MQQRSFKYLPTVKKILEICSSIICLFKSYNNGGSKFNDNFLHYIIIVFLKPPLIKVAAADGYARKFLLHEFSPGIHRLTYCSILYKN